MRKIDYIESNKYLRKGFQNLNDEDKAFLTAIWNWQLNPTDREFQSRIKQVVYHMQNWMSLRELRGLYKAFKTLEKLPD